MMNTYIAYYFMGAVAYPIRSWMYLPFKGGDDACLKINKGVERSYKIFIGVNYIVLHD